MTSDDQTPASPLHTPPSPETAGSTPAKRAYASPGTLARIAISLLAALMLEVIGIIALQARVNLVDQLRNGSLPSESKLVSADDHVSFAVDAWLACLLATGVVFIWWFQRLYGNLVAPGASGLRCTHGWSIGAWFVPFLNLVRPAQIANDTWQASDPDLAPGVGAAWRTGSRSPIVGVWWAVFLASGIVGRIASSRSTSTLDQIVTRDRLVMASSVVDAVAAAIAIVFVLQLTRRQAARAANLAGSV